MIFSRKRGTSARRAPGSQHESAGGPNPAGPISDPEPRERPEFGPYDASEALPEERLDLGALELPAVPGVEIRLQAGQQGEITGLVLLHEGSQLQLGVFAAPRTEGIWDEVRELVRSGLAANGARPEEVPGDYGPQVRARVRDQAGNTTIVRHVGIDGPRWFVHAIFFGAAAAEPDPAGPLTQVLRGLVVNRGSEARPVREALPLRLPPQAQQQLAAAAEQPAGAAAEAEAAEQDLTESDLAEAEAADGEVAEAEETTPQPQVQALPAKAAAAKAAPAKAAVARTPPAPATQPAPAAATQPSPRAGARTGSGKGKGARKPAGSRKKS